MVGGTSVWERDHLPPLEFATKIATLQPKAASSALSELRHAFSLEFAFAHPVMQSEAGQFLNRLRSSGMEIDDPYPSQSELSSASEDVDGRLVAEAEPLCPPLPVLAGVLGSFNLRMANTGRAILSSRGETPFRLACKIASLESGIATEGERTDLLIDLPPGRGITQPVRFRAPETPGRYRLSVFSLLETVRWLDELCSLDIEVVPEASASDVWNCTGIARDYGSDHIHAFNLLGQWLGERRNAKSKILEIGGNRSPMVEQLGIPAFNLDVDPYGLMTASILAGRNGHVTHIVGDGMNIPFPDGYFDAIVMFATFHHFPDPIGLLNHLRTKLATDGRIFLMCEPIGHVFAESNYEGYIRELEHGAYEQSFQPWEYAAMIRAAGLVVCENVMDAGSAKISLRPA
mgnify:CR=1 FL=1